MRVRLLMTVLVTAGLALWLAVPAQAVAGDLDPSFGGQGFVVFDGPGLHASSIATTIEGKIVVAGTSTSATGLDRVAAIRYLPDGRLDPTFSSDGFTVARYPSSTEVADMALQNGRKMVIVGTQSSPAPTPEDPYASRYVITVTRFRTDGALDPTFSGDGKLTTGLARNVGAQAVVVQTDGKIVVSGYSDGRVVLVRYRADGSLDPTFSGDGKTTAMSHGYSGTGELAIQPDGKLVVLDGSADVRRFLGNGNIDTSFGFGGRVSLVAWTFDPVGGEELFLNALAVQPNGRILFVGRLESDMGCGAEAYFGLIARLLPDGSLDPGFNASMFGTGDCEYNWPYDWFTDLALESDGRIVAAGLGVVVRFRPNGALATTFGTGGVARVPTILYSYEMRIAIQPDGRIVVASDSVAGEYGTAVMRFLAA